MSEIVVTLLGREAGETFAEKRPEDRDGATARGPKNGFEFREAEFDGVEVGAVGRQVAQLGASRRDEVADPLDVMGRQIVGDDDVPGQQRRDQDLTHIGEETLPIDRSVEDAGGGEARHAKRGNEGTRVPVALRRVVRDALPAEASAVPAQQIRGDAAFIEEYQSVGIQRRRDRLPGVASRPDIRPVVFGRAYRFF